MEGYDMPWAQWDRQIQVYHLETGCLVYYLLSGSAQLSSTIFDLKRVFYLCTENFSNSLSLPTACFHRSRELLQAWTPLWHSIAAGCCYPSKNSVQSSRSTDNQDIDRMWDHIHSCWGAHKKHLVEYPLSCGAPASRSKHPFGKTKCSVQLQNKVGLRVPF